MKINELLPKTTIIGKYKYTYWVIPIINIKERKYAIYGYNVDKNKTTKSVVYVTQNELLTKNSSEIIEELKKKLNDKILKEQEDE